jgi:asparagine synthase (glutamine-hydrolysing)
MCGFIASKNTTSIMPALRSMQYRGKNEIYNGYKTLNEFQFAHTSLPFVSLDPHDAVQPRDSYSLFVGEIFNYKDLGFKDDISCIVETFRKEGLNGFHKFDGFWSFVTLDNGELIGVTDHLGIKPIYYRTDVDVMASEPDALKEFGPVTRNKTFHSNVLKWGYSPTPDSPWNEIKQVPPGHYVKNRIVYPYWNWDIIQPTDLKTELVRSTELRLGGQQDISILLSGGLDSTIIYNIITKILKRDVTAIHVENGEATYADKVCKNMVHVTLGDVTDEDAVSIHQTPVDLGSTKPQIAMARKLGELGFHAVLTGDGADELFGGYRRASEYDSQHSDIFCELPYYHLPKLDRTMMYSTIELRAPFLAPPVVKYAMNLPYENRNGLKKALMETFEDLVPNEIIHRAKHPLKTDKIRKDPIDQRKINNKIWSELYG